MSRPLMAAIAAQQAVQDDQRKQIAIQAQQIALIARLAGITGPVNQIAVTADINNPAQPLEDGPEQAPSETTEQAATSETNDDVRAPGQTGNSTQGIPAAATDVPMQPGGTIAAEPYGNLQDVTSPVSGVNTGEVGGDQTKIESDVRVGNPMVPDVAFPWIGDNQSNSAPPNDGEMSQTGAPGRTHACLRLARLQIQAGIAQGDDLTLSARIEADPANTNAAISHEIDVLSRVVKSAARTTTASTSRVAARSTERVAPSLAPLTTATSDSQELSDLFI